MTEIELGPPRFRRHFVAIATATYDDPAFPQLPGVVDEVAVLRDWLCADGLGERGFTFDFPELSSDPSKRQIREALEDPQRPWTAADAAVVFLTGHGTVADGEHWIVLRTSDRCRPHATAQRTGELVAWLKETRVEHLLIILDLCYAGGTARAVSEFDLDFPRSWLPLASVTRNQTAKTASLSTAITRFLADLATPEGERFNHGPFLRVGEFLEELQRHLGEDQTLATLHPGLPDLGPHRCLPNPRWQPADQPVTLARRDLAIRPAEWGSHWAPKVQASESPQAGWLFTGRSELMHRLIAAATGPPGVTVVTGMAGTGKSAVLARLVTLSEYGFRAQHPALIAAIPAHLQPPLGAVDAAVLATGKLPHDVLVQLLETFSGTLPAANVSLTDLRSSWWRWLARHGEPVTIVVDALDEAPHPALLLTEVLAQLNPDPAAPLVRLIVGVRSPGGPDETPTARPEPDGGAIAVLADLAERMLAATRLRVDEPPLWSDQDLIDYAQSLLTRIPGSPYAADVTADAAETDSPARAVAHTIAARTGKSFLITRIAATSLVHRHDQLASDDRRLFAMLDAGVLGAFQSDLEASLDPADRARAVDLLRAVAFAYGAGLPWRQIWPLVSNAVVGRPGTYGDGDIAWLLASRIGAYLVADQEDGITVYRLFHDTLRATLHGGQANSTPFDLSDPTSAVEARIVDSLRPLWNVGGPHRQTLPPAYVRRHIVEHAAAGGVLDDRLLTPAFLPFVDAERLRVALINNLERNDIDPDLLFPWRHATHVWQWDVPQANAAALDFRAVAAKSKYRYTGVDRLWATVWAHFELGSGDIVGSHVEAAVAVTTLLMPDGEPVAVTGSWDATVQLWSLRTRSRFSSAVETPNSIESLAVLRSSNNRVIALTSGYEGELRRWDLISGAPIGTPLLGHTDRVRAAAAVVRNDGQLVGVTGSYDGTIRIFDIETGRPLAEPIADNPGPIEAVDAITLPEGTSIAVTGGHDEVLRLWDLKTGSSLGAIATDHIGPVDALAFLVLPDGSVVIASGGRDSTVRLWDMRAAAPICEPLIGHTDRVTSLAGLVEADDRAIVVSGSYDNTVRIWDVNAGVAIGSPLTGHTSPVEAVSAMLLPDKQPVAVSCGWDTTVRVWDLSVQRPADQYGADRNKRISGVAVFARSNNAPVGVASGWDNCLRLFDIDTGAPVGEPLAGHSDVVAAVATTVLPNGCPIAVSGSWDATVCLWDLRTGRLIGDPLSGHTDRIAAVSVLTLPNGQPIAVTGSRDRTVRIWDLATGKAIGNPLLGHTDSVDAVATLVLTSGEPVAVTGSADTTVRVWNLTSSLPTADPPLGHARSVEAVATLTLPGASIAVTGSWSPDGTLRVWDLDTGGPIGEPFGNSIADPQARVLTIEAMVLPNGRPIAVTGSVDGTVRLWDLATRTSIAYPLHVTASVESVAGWLSDSEVSLLVGGAGGMLARVDIKASLL